MESKCKFEPITKCGGVWKVNQDGKPKHRIKLPLAKKYLLTETVKKLEAEANQQLQAILKELFEKLDEYCIELIGDECSTKKRVCPSCFESLKLEYLGGK